MTQVQKQAARQTWLPGCSVLILVIVISIIIAISLFIQKELAIVQYPGSIPVRAYQDTIYRLGYLRLERAFRSRTPRTDIHHWYADEFQLTPFSEDDECVALERSNQNLGVGQTMKVLVCEVSGQRMIYVTRAFWNNY